MILFFLLCSIALLLTYVSDKMNKFAFLFIGILLLTILSGFRDYSVGTDTHNYHYVFNNYRSDMVYTYGQERGFLEIAKVVVFIFKTDRAMFVICAFVTNFMILMLLWKIRNRCSLTLMSFFYITLFYPETMNIMRQYVGVAIVFFCTYLLYKRKYKAYVIISIICGIVFHRSILIAVPIALLWYVLFDKGNYRKFKVFVLIILSMPFILAPVINIANEYSWYFVEGNFVIGISLLSNIVIYFIYCHIYLTSIKPNLDEETISIEKFLIYTYGISLVFNLIGCYYDYMGRIGLCFSLFKVPLYARMCTNNKYCQLFKIINLGLAFYYIIVRVAINGECGIFPYSMELQI